MKKLKHKLLRRKKSKEPEKHERITNETVAEHRERILAGGRKFKYPVQYARHRLVINTIIVSTVALILLVAITWWQLYPVQNTNSFFYRLTQLLPLPVASVDGQNVEYQDYLMEYRSSIHWLERKSRGFSLNSRDGQAQSRHFKRQSLDRAIEAAYAEKLAKQRNITVTNKEIDQFVDKTLQSGSRKLSRQSYEAVLSDSYGVSVNEYRRIVKQALLKQKVSFTIDDAAKKKIEAARAALGKGQSFDVVVGKYSDDSLTKTAKGDVGFVPQNNQDQGLAVAASKLKKGEISKIIKGTDAYYIIKLTDTKAEQVRYSKIKVSLKAFKDQLNQLKKDGKIHEYISVPNK